MLALVGEYLFSFLLKGPQSACTGSSLYLLNLLQRKLVHICDSCYYARSACLLFKLNLMGGAKSLRLGFCVAKLLTVWLQVCSILQRYVRNILLKQCHEHHCLLAFISLLLFDSGVPSSTTPALQKCSGHRSLQNGRRTNHA